MDWIAGGIALPAQSQTAAGMSAPIRLKDNKRIGKATLKEMPLRAACPERVPAPHALRAVELHVAVVTYFVLGSVPYWGTLE